MSDILKEADEIAGTGERARDYGHPAVNLQRIATIWNVQLGVKLSQPLTSRDVGLLMVGMKLAREVEAQKRDNLIDIAGYVKCVAMVDDTLSKSKNGL